MCVYVVYGVNTEQTSKTLGFHCLRAFSLLKLAVSQFPSKANQFSVDDLGLDKNIASLAKE